MNITRHFTSSEFSHSSTAIRLGLKNEIPFNLLPNALKVCRALETIRESYNLPIIISSGYRSPELNKLIGGSSSSSHMTGEAVDFTIPGISNVDICKEIPKILESFDQVIYEFGPQGWVHLGMGPLMRNELLTASKEGSKTVYKTGILEV